MSDGRRDSDPNDASKAKSRPKDAKMGTVKNSVGRLREFCLVTSS